MLTAEKKPRLFLIFLALLSAFAPFSTDIYLASMPTIGRVFQSSIDQVQLTLALFFVSFAVGQLVWGPLSDRIGRRPVIFLGAMIFFIASLWCALSPTIEWLILARVFQGFGACAGIVMSVAIIRDSYQGHSSMSDVLATIMSITMIAPMIAPVIGSYLLVHINWQANFYFLAGYGLLLLVCTYCFEETYPKVQRQPLPMGQLWFYYRQQFFHWPFLLSTLAVCASFGVLFSFISSASYIYITIYHLQPTTFAYLFMLNASSLIITSRSLKYITQWIAEPLLIAIAVGMMTTASLLMLVVLHFDSGHLYLIIIPAFFAMIGFGLAYPGMMGLVLSHVVQFNGLASSLVGTCRFLAAAFVGIGIGAVLADSAMPLAVFMSVSAGACVVFLLLYRRAVFQMR